jgi:probable rRNA maturation factor
MRGLNRRYRGIDRTTDVLSFSMLEGEAAGVNAGKNEGGPPPVLGDIVISVPQAGRQAEGLGRPLEDELVFLVVHGLLHIIGYDHERGPAEARKMYAKQRDIIRLLKAA